MSCARIRRQLERLADGALPIDERWLLEDHLERCEACARLAASYERLDAALEQEVDPTVVGEELEAAVRGIRARLEQPLEPVAASSRVRRAWLVAAAALLLGVGGLAIGFGLRGAGSTDPARAPERVVVTLLEPERFDEGPGDLEVPISVAPTDEERLRALLARADEFEDDAFLAELVSVRSSRSRVRLIEDALVAESLPVRRGAARALALEADPLSLHPLGRAFELAQGEDDVAGIVASIASFGSRGSALLVRGLGRPAGAHEHVVEALADLARRGVDGPADALLSDWLKHAEAGDRARADRSLTALLSLPDGVRAFDALRGLRPEAARSAAFDTLRASPHSAALFGDWLGERVDLDASLWRMAELTETEPVRAWLVRRVADRRSRARALACLERWSPAESLVAWLELDVRGGLGTEDLAACFAASLAADPQAAQTFAWDLVRRALNGGQEERATIRRFVNWLLEIGTPDCAPALRAFLHVPAVLDEDQPRWIALGLAEFGDEQSGLALARELADGLVLDRFARAAAWLAVERTAGIDALAPLVADLDPRDRRRILQAFEAPNTVGLARIARVLDRNLDPVLLTETP